jgi:hypothetical protein
MTPRRLFPLAFAVAAFTAACSSDSAMAPNRGDKIVGTWISMGSDVAVGLTSTMRAAMVKATFTSDSTYRIELTDSSYNVSTFTGTWSASSSSQHLRTITLTQTSPAASSGQGVFQIDGARMTFEVGPMTAQGIGNSVASGFGATTSQDGSTSSVWVQRFWNEDAAVTAPPCNQDTSTVLGKRPCERHDWTQTGKTR